MVETILENLSWKFKVKSKHHMTQAKWQFALANN